MGLIAKVLSFARVVKSSANISDVKSDPGGGANFTAEHFSSPGDDSHPLPIDFNFCVEIPRTGNFASVGYADVKNAGMAKLGEKRIYSRDSSGNVVATGWLKNTGEITLFNSNSVVTIKPNGDIVLDSPNAMFEVLESGLIKGVNGNGNFELGTNGTFSVNGLTIDSSGNLQTSGSIRGATVTHTSGGDVSLKDHTHGGVDTGSGSTGPAQ